jgi:hypothetical protein
MHYQQASVSEMFSLNKGRKLSPRGGFQIPENPFSTSARADQASSKFPSVYPPPSALCCERDPHQRELNP